MNKTYIKSKNKILKEWYIINAKNQILGRLISQIIKILLKKNKNIYIPFLIPNIRIIIINAKKIILSGNKEATKRYLNYSGYPNGLKFKTFFKLKQQDPQKIIKKALIGMIPKNIIGQKSYKNIYVYNEKYHTHHAQQAKIINISNEGK